MAIMSMRMLAALQAAHRAGAIGLKYTVGGWVEEAKPHAYHSFTTVSALLERGDLSKQRGLKGEGARCFITQHGRQSVVDAEAGMRRAM